MTPTVVALVSAACISGGALLGMALRRMRPDDLTEPSKDVIKLGAGVISLMSALVLGLLVTSAKSNFDSTTAAVTEAGARAILLDRVLAHYGAEAADVRADLRQAIIAGLEILWPERRSGDSALEAFERANATELVLEKIRALKPQTEAQRALQAQAQQLGNDLALIRWLQIEQAHTPLPPAFLEILLFWLTMLYISFGLIAPRNATVAGVLLGSALALATAIFLIVEMNDPMRGVIKVSSGPWRKTLEHVGR